MRCVYTARFFWRVNSFFYDDIYAFLPLYVA
jgi:hypothetical protein